MRKKTERPRHLLRKKNGKDKVFLCLYYLACVNFLLDVVNMVF
jgi:hypothetical protein